MGYPISGISLVYLRYIWGITQVNLKYIGYIRYISGISQVYFKPQAHLKDNLGYILGISEVYIRNIAGVFKYIYGAFQVSGQCLDIWTLSGWCLHGV